ncbi:MAG: hypothetical protein M1586_01695 [Patescibacteria group bacterium]|nr:hypothetical protein [Patescibacteria group bacterium]MCL5261997.1 hypothetical protein [Patescibacteria group bacterium]
MKKATKYIIAAIVIVVFVCLGMWLWPLTSWANYYAVAIETGDVYFGKLSYFPCLQLRDVWYLRQTGNQENPYSVVKFTDLRWSPEDRLILNREHVIWTVRLDRSGQVAAFLKNPTARQPMTGGTAGETQAPAPSGE